MKTKKFGIVHASAMRDPSLSLRAKGLYALLCTYSDKEGVCYPAISTLSEMCGVSRRTTERIINELIDKKYVTRQSRKFRLSEFENNNGETHRESKLHN